MGTNEQRWLRDRAGKAGLIKLASIKEISVLVWSITDQLVFGKHKRTVWCEAAHMCVKFFTSAPSFLFFFSFVVRCSQNPPQHKIKRQPICVRYIFWVYQKWISCVFLSLAVSFQISSTTVRLSRTILNVIAANLCFKLLGYQPQTAARQRLTKYHIMTFENTGKKRRTCPKWK